jgi:hypothetical protein
MDELVTQLYQAFAHYRKPKDFPACECCLSPAERKLLLSKPLLELSAEELSVYAASAFLTVAGPEDFKYFLPRILELAVKEEFSWPDIEITLGKLAKADWLQWPDKERCAVLDLLNRKWEDLLKNSENDSWQYSQIDEWVCALGQCVPDVTLYLDKLLEPGCKEKLLGFAVENSSAYTENKLSNAFWDTALDNHRRTLIWLKQPQIKNLLTECYGMSF